MKNEKLEQLSKELRAHIDGMTSEDWQSWYKNQFKEEEFERANMELKMKIRLFKIQFEKNKKSVHSSVLFHYDRLATDNFKEQSITVETISTVKEKTTVKAEQAGSAKYAMAA